MPKQKFTCGYCPDKTFDTMQGLALHRTRVHKNKGKLVSSRASYTLLDAVVRLEAKRDQIQHEIDVLRAVQEREVPAGN